MLLSLSILPSRILIGVHPDHAVRVEELVVRFGGSPCSTG
jgi:hypothetical protein